MIRKMRLRKNKLAIAALVVALCFSGSGSLSAFAQPPAKPKKNNRPNIRPESIPFNTQKRGDFYNLSRTPISVLKTELKLTPEQEEKILKTRQKEEDDIRDLENGENAPKDRVTYLTSLKEIQNAKDKEIVSYLDSDQKKRTTKLFKELNLLRPLFIPAEAYSELKLTPEQIMKAERMAPGAEQEHRNRLELLKEAQRSKDMEKVGQALAALSIKPNPSYVSLFTPAQKLVLAKYAPYRLPSN